MTREHVIHVRRAVYDEDEFLATRSRRAPTSLREIAQEHHLFGLPLFDSKGKNMDAWRIGASLYMPEKLEHISVNSSPTYCAAQAAGYMIMGLMHGPVLDDYLRGFPRFSSNKELCEHLHYALSYEGLVEPQSGLLRISSLKEYELICEAHQKKGSFSHDGYYSYLAERGFAGDKRLEHPRDVAIRGLKDILRWCGVNDVIIAVSHQWNLEAMTAFLAGNIGNSAEEMYANAGGTYGLGHGFELRLQMERGKTVDAILRRTTTNPLHLDKELPLDRAVLDEYAVSLCGGCDARPGALHSDFGCDHERCPFCHEQRSSCGCEQKRKSKEERKSKKERIPYMSELEMEIVFGD